MSNQRFKREEIKQSVQRNIMLVTYRLTCLFNLPSAYRPRKFDVIISYYYNHFKIRTTIALLAGRKTDRYQHLKSSFATKIPYSHTHTHTHTLSPADYIFRGKSRNLI